MSGRPSGQGADVTGLDAVKYVAAVGAAAIYNMPSAGFVPGEVALVDKWVAFDADQLAPPAAVVVNMLTNKTAFDKHAFDDAMKAGPGRHCSPLGPSPGERCPPPWGLAAAFAALSSSSSSSL